MILLVDMDYFYAACEEIKRPELRTKPTIVGSDPKGGRGRGVVMTCNYVARKVGIHSGMPISAAYKIKPDANYLPMDYSYYEAKSKEVMAILKESADKLEQVSIDEAFVDLSNKVKDYNEALDYAARIKKTIKDKVKLPCSIGISTNKLMAKMACESAKPNGIKVIKDEDKKAFLEKMPVGELYGVGRKTKEKLEKMGYETVGKLSGANIMDLIKEFGSFGTELHNYANGIDDSKIEENYQIKSIGRETTFEFDTNDPDKITVTIARLSNEVFDELKRMGFSFKVVTFKARYPDFSESLKSKMVRPSNDLQIIKDTATKLYNKYFDSNKKLRKIGIRVSQLTEYKSQKKLF